MNRYRSVSSATGEPSGVSAYEYGLDYITIKFTSGRVYTYTVKSCGSMHIENMKVLGDRQNGLSTYIATRRPPYSSKR